MRGPFTLSLGFPVRAGIQCKRCSATDEVVLPHGKNPGYAHRAFKNRGWLVHERHPGRHLCPTCAHAPAVSHAAATTVASDARAMNSDVRPEVALPAARAQVIADTINPPIVDAGEAAEIDRVMGLASRDFFSTLSAKPPKQRPGRRAHDPVYAPPELLQPDAQDSPAFRRGHRTPANARRSVTLFLARCGVTSPVEGDDYTILRSGPCQFGWDALKITPHKKEQPIMETPTELPAVPTWTERLTVAAPPRTPTRHDLRSILDALDAAYDTDKQRYRGEASDLSVAEKLDVPRAWVATERERAFGPEANEAGEKADAKWRLAMTTQAALLSRAALDLAAQAETLMDAIKEGPKA